MATVIAILALALGVINFSWQYNRYRREVSEQARAVEVVEVPFTTTGRALILAEVTNRSALSVTHLFVTSATGHSGYLPAGRQLPPGDTYTAEVLEYEGGQLPLLGEHPTGLEVRFHDSAGKQWLRTQDGKLRDLDWPWNRRRRPVPEWKLLKLSPVPAGVPYSMSGGASSDG